MTNAHIVAAGRIRMMHAGSGNQSVRKKHRSNRRIPSESA